jgi:threonine synthase
VNSINWARILAQTVYYFLAYFSLRRATGGDADVQFVVPTGNFGDILAGYYAKKMGLPMAGKLGVATNANDILARFWKTGRYEKADSSPMDVAPSMEPAAESSDGKQGIHDKSGVKETLSPAMDILVSSNFERLLWYLVFENVPQAEVDPCGKAGETVAGWMSKMKSDGRVEVPTSVLDSARRDFCAERVSDEEVSFVSTFVNSYVKFFLAYVDTRDYQGPFPWNSFICRRPSHCRRFVRCSPDGTA